ncbi:MAG: ATP-binding cassette domain-containing protein, partial [Mobilitalea sp.]
RGATILMSSHILSEVQRLCDRVAIIKEGKIIKQEKIATLQEHSYKRFKFEVAQEVPTNYFKLEGVSDLKVEGKIHSFIYNGDINVITSKISGIKLTNLWADEPDLEEIFLHYYSKEA